MLNNTDGNKAGYLNKTSFLPSILTVAIEREKNLL